MSQQKVAYVTGGMGGIGTAICQRLHKDGFKVIAGCGPTPRLQASGSASRRRWATPSTPRSATSADWDSTVEAFTKAKAEHGADRRAGQQRRHHARPHVPEDDARGLGRGDRDQPELACSTSPSRWCGDMVEKGWGRIINISSVNGEKGQAGQTNYSAAKAGMHGFTMALAQEVANKGVTVNTVSPGYIGTDMVKAIRPDVLDKIVATHPGQAPGHARGDRVDRRLARRRRIAASPPAPTSPSTAACTWGSEARPSQ